MKLEDLEIPIKELKGVGDKTAWKLEKNKIKTLRDLLFYFPYKYLDLTKIKKIKDLKINESAVIFGKIKEIKLFPSPKKRMFLLNVIIEDETGALRIVWYNQPFLLQKLKSTKFILTLGKLKKTRYGINFEPIKFETLNSATEIKPRIIPVYSEMERLTTNFFEKLIQNFLQKYDLSSLKDPLPQEILKNFNYPTLGEAILKLHQPKNLEEVKLAEERLSFEELLYLELALLLERKKLQKNKAPIFQEDEELTQKFLSQFNFGLTEGQKRVLKEIYTDLKKGVPMNRLLQGETGAGKTLIAEILTLNVIKNDYQVIFMAPTEILTQQHFQRFLKDFSMFNYGLALVTSGGIYYGERGFRAFRTLSEINRFLSLGKIKILIGTHSLIENEFNFQNIGLIIIDEQQRFGVEQRKKLLKQTKQETLPHFLSLSATPIPRTLALALYGDLDFSYLEEKPLGQRKIKTYVVSSKKEETMWNFVKKEINEGHQIFVICPRVEEKEDEIKSVKEEYQRVKKILPEANIAMLHGKMKAPEKELILRKMQKNEINVLVSSSVIEVGLDLPLATVIIIQSPERFGLAQLYQLRGRVGRSIHQGYCFLVPQKLTSKAKLRLKYFLQAKSALELSEYDLKLRGGGELLGERQAGIPDLAMKSLSNLKLIERAKKIAEEILKNFDIKKYPLLKREIEKRRGYLMA